MSCSVATRSVVVAANRTSDERSSANACCTAESTRPVPDVIARMPGSKHTSGCSGQCAPRVACFPACCSAPAPSGPLSHGRVHSNFFATFVCTDVACDVQQRVHGFGKRRTNGYER
eukprot:72832-Chlamydomonas_euryale.AAC.12